MQLKTTALFVLITYSIIGKAQIVDTIKVHFLYGSKPAKAFRHLEAHCFGGKLGGHVGIESDSGEIINFLPKGTFHYLAHNSEPHSAFITSSPRNFWEILGGDLAWVKKTTIHIPISANQKKDIDSIHQAYQEKTPYDYAFLGMRCGAATYDILAKAGILKEKSQLLTSLLIFYPRKLRHRLMRLSKEEGWKVCHQAGGARRKWERDFKFTSVLRQCSI